MKAITGDERQIYKLGNANNEVCVLKELYSCKNIFAA
jgi:hypothetical protein